MLCAAVRGLGKDAQAGVGDILHAWLSSFAKDAGWLVFFANRLIQCYDLSVFWEFILPAGHKYPHGIKKITGVISRRVYGRRK